MSDEPRDEDRGRERAQDRALHIRELDKERRSRVVKIVVALALIVVFVLFVIRNSKPVSKSGGVDFVFFTRDVRLIWVFLVCGLVAGVVGYLLGRPSKAQRRTIRETQEKAPPAEPSA